MLKVVALCASLADAAAFERRLRGPDSRVDLVLLVTRAQPKPRFVGALARDFVRLGPRGAANMVALLVRRRLRITFAALSDRPVLDGLHALNADVGLHATPVIYRSDVIVCFRLGILNAHIGLLPKYRGRSVMEWSIVEGDPTGITTFFIDEGIDTGTRIILREEMSVRGFGTVRSAKSYLFSLAPDMYAQALTKLGDPDFVPLRQQLAEGKRWYVMSALLAGVVDELLSNRVDGASDSYYESTLRRELLIKGYQRRLAEQTSWPGGATPPRAVSTSLSDEEHLRVLMVRLWPPFVRGSETIDERRTLFEHADALRTAAKGEDTRFLDALNCVYEAVAARLGDHEQITDDVRTFLCSYFEIVAHQIERLERSHQAAQALAPGGA